MKVDGLVAATSGVTRYCNKFERESLFAFQTGAKITTEWEKSSHIWKNRTYQAEKRIKCVAFRQGMMIILENSHGVFYGLYLELHHERKFAILQQAIRRHWLLIMQLIKSRMSQNTR
jgi:hypothetical protein